MKYIVLIILVITLSGCFEFEELSELPETPFEATSDVEVIKVTGHLSRLYLGNEWETYIYIEVLDEYLEDDMGIVVYRDGRIYRAISVPFFNDVFYDKAPHNASHCYTFAIVRGNQFSKNFVTDYCLEFK